MPDLRTIDLSEMGRTPFRGTTYTDPAALLADYGYHTLTLDDLVWIAAADPDDLAWFVAGDHPELTSDEAFFLARVLIAFTNALAARAVTTHPGNVEYAA